MKLFAKNKQLYYKPKRLEVDNYYFRDNKLNIDLPENFTVKNSEDVNFKTVIRLIEKNSLSLVPLNKKLQI